MSDDIKILEDLWRVIEEKSSSQDKDSYTKTMLEKDTNTLARKMGEEAIETIVAAIGQSRGMQSTKVLIYYITGFY